jgi:uncharacterized membrane protein YeaQ/YmgE (transglycosylase-associated protein family)
MSLIDFLILLLIAGICGAIGKSIGGFNRGGFLASIGIGFLGAVIGTWIARELALPGLFMLDIGSTTFPVVWAIIGSLLLVLLLGFLTRKRVL